MENPNMVEPAAELGLPESPLEVTNMAPSHTEWAQLDLEDAGRFVANEARAAQEAAWAEANVNPRQIWGAREAQRMFSTEIRGAVAALQWACVLARGCLQETSILQSMVPSVLLRIVEFISQEHPNRIVFISSWQKAPRYEGGLLLCARKRPFLAFERSCIECDSVQTSPVDNTVLVHDGRLSRSGRQLLMTHRRFVLDRAWGKDTSTETIYQDVVAPLVQALLLGKSATVFCMGQTGTGKTYTIQGITECLGRDLKGRDDVHIEAFEIYGRKCLDLLAERKEVHIRADSEDRVHVRGQCSTHVNEGQDFMEPMSKALKLRASEETERNAASSRSHAIFTVRLTGAGSELRLVDLAGSERNFETTKMTAQQHKDFREINSSLHVLKDCFRAYAANQRGEMMRIPFRGSQVTQVLRTCFTDSEHQTVAIATVSPTTTDAIHTVNTLKHLTMLSKPLADLTTELTVDVPLHLQSAKNLLEKPVKTWTPEDVHAWLRWAEGGRFAHLVLPPDLDGWRLLCTSPQGLSDLFEGTLRRARVDQEGEAWNVQVDRVGIEIGLELFAAARRLAFSQGYTPAV